MQPRASASILFFAILLLLASPVQAQHPTAVTSIVNSSADTTLEVNHNGSLLMPGTFVTDGTENDSIPATGAGTRLMWYPAKAAFRAGQVDGTEWDASNVGDGSVAFGEGTKASNAQATAMGFNTAASGQQATAMGLGTTASGGSATAMGTGTTANAADATAVGWNSTASGLASLALGVAAEAATNYSVSIGQCNRTNTSGDNSVFVVGNGDIDLSNGSCFLRSDALTLDKKGNLSIEGVLNDDLGTFAAHIQGSENADARGNPAANVALVENTNSGDGGDVLAIQAGETASNIQDNTNFITFYGSGDTDMGALEGDGNGGIQLNSGGADFAEKLPVAEGAEVPEAGELVGVKSGKLRLSTGNADRVMITSTAPIVTGNAPSTPGAGDARSVAVAFVGQVPAKVRGSVEIGDLIVASGKEDGTGRAVAPSEYRRSKHGPVAGQAWSAKETSTVGEVSVAVGLGRSGAVADQLEEQRRENQRQEEQIADLKTENKEIKERLAALERQHSSTLPAGWGPAALLLLLVGGGSFGAGLLWRREG
ncbi:hypothetical protein BSZ35_18260 [Salinibacter sp. 10B]|uniref:hypothetical protein n=1 Tax=Salinibacter sp. 10B TaxID=1923971 RepID=UPI000CF3A5D2|nr:hypothetical protein [Salinibacter sp. 10B]PQJ26874.1 hypothetical protein BSZ35_18260 [Salinibacter sp. 10B]